MPTAAPDPASARAPETREPPTPAPIAERPSGAPVTLTNAAPDCHSPGHVRGYATVEDGHIAVARITDATPGFVATAIRVPLLHDPRHVDECRGDMPHEVVWFTAPGPRPPDNPRIESVSVEPTGSDTQRTLHAELPGVRVPDGHALYVGVRVVATSVEATCIVTCGDYVDNDVSWWSHAKTPPFAWEAFEDHDPPLVVDLAIEVDGIQ